MEPSAPELGKSDPRLPNWHKAIIPEGKLAGYCLNPNHHIGGHKALLFQKLLDLGPEHADQLETAIRQAISTRPAIIKRADHHGTRWEVRFWMDHKGRNIPVVSAWIVTSFDHRPRLTSCYIV